MSCCRRCFVVSNLTFTFQLVDEARFVCQFQLNPSKSSSKALASIFICCSFCFCWCSRVVFSPVISRALYLYFLGTLKSLASKWQLNRNLNQQNKRKHRMRMIEIKWLYIRVLLLLLLMLLFRDVCVCFGLFISFPFIFYFLFSIESGGFYIRCRFCEISMKFNGARYIHSDT